jgi:hypothetical protein
MIYSLNVKYTFSLPEPDKWIHQSPNEVRSYADKWLKFLSKSVKFLNNKVFVCETWLRWIVIPCLHNYIVFCLSSITPSIVFAWNWLNRRCFQRSLWQDWTKFAEERSGDGFCCPLEAITQGLLKYSPNRHTVEHKVTSQSSKSLILASMTVQCFVACFPYFIRKLIFFFHWFHNPA